MQPVKSFALKNAFLWSQQGKQPDTQLHMIDDAKPNQIHSGEIMST